MSLFELGSADRRWLSLPDATKDELRRLFAQLFQFHEKCCPIDDPKGAAEVNDE